MACARDVSNQPKDNIGLCSRRAEVGFDCDCCLQPGKRYGSCSYSVRPPVLTKGNLSQYVVQISLLVVFQPMVIPCLLDLLINPHMRIGRPEILKSERGQLLSEAQERHFVTGSQCSPPVKMTDDHYTMSLTSSDQYGGKMGQARGAKMNVARSWSSSLNQSSWFAHWVNAKNSQPKLHKVNPWK